MAPGSVVGIYACEYPTGATTNQPFIVVLLCKQAMMLYLLQGADPTVSGDIFVN
jgi:hypothetical protein